MKTVTFQVPEEIYESMQALAAESATPFEDVVAEYLAQRVRKQPPQVDKSCDHQAERSRLLRYAGIFSSGDPNSADNDRIDTDLVREYGESHEQER